jgi:hypothetical protein
MAKVSMFESLTNCLAGIKRLGSILAGDTVGNGDPWQKVALIQAAEMRFYALLLERVAAGKEGGGVVFPSWDAEGVDGVDSPVPPEEIQGVPQPGVMPAWGGIPPGSMVCCLCNGIIEPQGSWLSGHNAEPVAKGRCCGRCNGSVVIPARVREFSAGRGSMIQGS